MVTSAHSDGQHASTFPAQGNYKEVDVGPKEEAADALVLQDATTEVARQEVSSSYVPKDVGNISEMFSELETKDGSEAKTRVPRRARSYVV
ncbi:hypothetical protein DVH24_023323 [Malus domestica]|uniref:Uncharacterized protein n=1 Tax=Malus domestica TaxID=3750 RepID=A0A498KTX0_MALDO|nr:hypothetical protein DVH24_023323 [Malus domestica]